MEIKLSDVGKLVVLPIKESWGPGKIMKIEAGYAFIRFRDDGDKMMKKYTIGNNPLKWAPEQSDSELDEISSQPAKRRKGPSPVAHLTLAQALEFFTAKYPQGFTDPAYLGNVLKDEKGHHDFLSHLYKDAFGDGRLETLLDNRDYDTLSGKSLTLLTAQDLLGRDDLKAFRDLLSNHSATMVYFEALNTVLKDWHVIHDTLHPYFETVMASPVKGFANWPNATLFLYMSQPNRFMFLKPKTIKNFASAMGINLLYETKLNWRTYHSLLMLGEDVLEKTRPLGSKDHRDVQAFITVVMESAKTSTTV
jgi:hypothetical protein